MKPGIDPKVDCVFKAILGSEEHKALLVHFLNAVLAREPGKRIQDVELLNPYNEREFETDKLSVVDVKARDETGRWYQIEIQLALHEGLTARMLYTWSAIYHSQMSKGKAYTALQPVIVIWLLNESLFPIPGAYHLPFELWDREHGILLSEDLRIDLLQLSEWPGPRQQYDELDRWLYLFRDGEQVDLDALPAMLQSNEMREAIHVLQHISENQREYLRYQQHLEALSLEATKQAEREEAKRIKEEFQRLKEETKRLKEETKRHEEEAKHREEQERQEKERLLQLLREAGIDPNQQPGHNKA